MAKGSGHIPGPGRCSSLSGVSARKTGRTMPAAAAAGQVAVRRSRRQTGSGAGKFLVAANFPSPANDKENDRLLRRRGPE